MDKLAAYALVLEDHPLWTKIAGRKEREALNKALEVYRKQKGSVTRLPSGPLPKKPPVTVRSTASTGDRRYRAREFTRY